MSLRICAAEWLLSTQGGVGFAQAWFPRLVTERFVGSVRDGDQERAPDQLPYIDADVTWVNTTGTDQHVSVMVQVAPRSWVTSNPNAVAIDDAVSFDVGEAPNAPRPSRTRAGTGGFLKVTRPSQNAMQFGRLFADRDDHGFYEHVGLVASGEAVHFRYMGLFSTPGSWRAPVEPRLEAFARYVRLRVFAAPHLAGVI